MPYRLVAGLAPLLLVVTSGCELLDSKSESVDPWTLQLSTATGHIPSFGGFTFGEAAEPTVDSLVVYVLAADSLASAREAVRRLFGRDHEWVRVAVKPPNPCACGSDALAVLWGLPGVTGVGRWENGYGVVYVGTAAGVIALERRLNAQGVPPGAFRIGVMGAPWKLAEE